MKRVEESLWWIILSKDVSMWPEVSFFHLTPRRLTVPQLRWCKRLFDSTIWKRTRTIAGAGFEGWLTEIKQAASEDGHICHWKQQLTAFMCNMYSCVCRIRDPAGIHHLPVADYLAQTLIRGGVKGAGHTGALMRWRDQRFHVYLSIWSQSSNQRWALMANTPCVPVCGRRYNTEERIGHKKIR